MTEVFLVIIKQSFMISERSEPNRNQKERPKHQRCFGRRVLSGFWFTAFTAFDVTETSQGEACLPLRPKNLCDVEGPTHRTKRGWVGEACLPHPQKRSLVLRVGAPTEKQNRICFGLGATPPTRPKAVSLWGPCSQTSSNSIPTRFPCWDHSLV